MKSSRLRTLLSILTAVVAFYFCTSKRTAGTGDFHWKKMIPATITDTFYTDPANPFSEAKAALGRYLFYDRRLSFNKTKSCASCHDPQFSFTDSYRRSIGALGDLHQRNASPLINLIFRKYLTAADSTLHYPEQQMNNPMFHDQPVELGWKGNETEIMGRIKRDPEYGEKFKGAFPGTPEPVTIQNIQYSIATFIKTIVSFQSPYDQSVYLKKDNLSDAEKEGRQLFFSKKTNCASCHGGFDFATPSVKGVSGQTDFYFNTGLYNISGNGNYPDNDQGLFEKTRHPSDMGKYRVPTLRNLAFTAPYYHDGTAESLEDVIQNYEQGGRVIDKGTVKGNGIRNPYKSPLINGFSLTSQERKDLVQFLLSLSDSSLLKNKSISNPFQHDETN